MNLISVFVSSLFRLHVRGGAPLGHSMNLISVFVSSLFRLHVRGGAPLGHPMNLISVFVKRLAVLCSILVKSS